MFKKALFYKEYKEIRSLLLLCFALVFLVLPLTVMQGLNNFERILSDMTGGLSSSYMLAESYYLGVPPYFHLDISSGITFVLFFLVLTVACFQIGLERDSGHDNFTLSLPYKREGIYLSKWLVGSVGLSLILAINFIIAGLSIYFSPIKNYLVVEPAFWPFIFNLWLSTLALYTFTLFFGTISGKFIFQAAFSFIFSLFPLGFFLLLSFFYSVNFGRFPDTGSFGELIINLSLLLHFVPLTGYTVLLQEGIPLIDLVYIVLFLAGGVYFYRKNKVEYNGHLLIFPELNTFFVVGITICFALLGGLITSFGSLSTGTAPQFILYYAGALILGALSYVLTKRFLPQ